MIRYIYKDFHFKVKNKDSWLTYLILFLYLCLNEIINKKILYNKNHNVNEKKWKKLIFSYTQCNYYFLLHMYFDYILKCSDESLYTWITTDLERRLCEHNTSDLWAKYTSARRPVHLVYFETLENRSLASKRELVIKKMTKKQKNELIKSQD